MSALESVFFNFFIFYLSFIYSLILHFGRINTDYNNTAYDMCNTLFLSVILNKFRPGNRCASRGLILYFLIYH